MCVRACVRACVRVCVRACVRAIVRACHRACVRVCNMTQLVNSMNDFFVSLSVSAYRFDATHRVFDIDEPLPAEFTIEAASTQSALQKVKCRKATEPDNIPPWMVKNYAHVLAVPVMVIFNSSLREGKLPDLWKTTILSSQFQRNIRPAQATFGPYHVCQYWRKFLKLLYSTGYRQVRYFRASAPCRLQQSVRSHQPRNTHCETLWHEPSCTSCKSYIFC